MEEVEGFQGKGLPFSWVLAPLSNNKDSFESNFAWVASK